jgi:hypothetical protein
MAGSTRASDDRRSTVPALRGRRRTTASVSPVLRRLRQPLVLEEHGREDELQVRRREAVARADEGHGLSEVRGERASAAKQPADEIAQRVGRGESLHTLRPHEQAVGEMIDQVRADGGELANDVDTDTARALARADAREL